MNSRTHRGTHSSIDSGPGATAGSASAAAITRRRFVAGAAGSALAAQAPWVRSQKRPRLRVLGTHVTLRETLRQRAMADLGIDIVYEPRGEGELVHKASTRPDSYDVYEQWTDSIRQLWRADAIQPIDTERLEYWSEINSLSRTGRLTPDAKLGLGDAPHRILNVQSDGGLGEDYTGKISFLPYVHNVDSFGYNTDVIPRGIPYETESWSWLLDPAWRGRVGIINAPTIGLFDLALAVASLGLMQFRDMSDMSVAELDELFAILRDYKRDGQFGAFWGSVPQSVEFMTSGRVVIESMFSPGVATANGLGTPVAYAAPKEGYRGWHGVMCLSRECRGEALDAAYKYMNWWLSGWPGAFISRQGYYISNPQRSRPLMTENEWAYWYEGQPTREPLPDPDGNIAVPVGAVRNGGSYERRFKDVAVWNTVMNNYEYSLQRWYELLLA
ncbi:MAG: extracellular solute-binding protein [Halieaceae bacterium]|jgi:putative spermidine/putrescine transport system substrate-binding protein|nr:extracellular solute-binding protein [Halieaceae bacterium]